MAKIINVNNRNKTIEKPYFQEGKTFGEFLCQYSVFENEVRFESCIFTNDVIFGDESNDQAFCVVKSDLVFNHCTFHKQVKLDGLQCAGHVIFKGGCTFEFDGGDKESDYALSLSNATIGLGICLQDVSLKAGINLSATTIKQVGCQFENVKLNNGKSRIDFSSSYLGKELSIKTSNIICDFIGFEAVSVDNHQGTIQLGGNSFIGYKENTQVIKELISSRLNLDECSCDKIITVFKNNKSDNSPLVLVNETDTKFNPGAVVELFKSITKVSYERDVYYRDKKYIDNSKLFPIGEIMWVSEVQTGKSFFVISFADTIYINYDEIVTIDFNDYASNIFSIIVDDVKKISKTNRKNENEETVLDYRRSNHNGFPMIYATTPFGDTYISIYDSNQLYKIYKWNYIQCNSILDLSDCHIGRGLYVRQSEINTTKIDLHSSVAAHLIDFTDVVLHMYQVNASYIKVPTIRFNNIMVSENSMDYLQWIDNTDFLFFGINLDSAKLDNLSISLELLEDMLELNPGGMDDFLIYAPNMSVNNLLEIEDNREYHHYVFHIDLKCSKLNRWNIGLKNRGGVKIETESTDFNNILLNGDSRPPFKSIKNLLDRSVVGNSKDKYKTPIHFLKQIDSIYEQYDLYDEQRKIWKFRNRKRILRDHKYSAWLRILTNVLLLNYGWSPWRIVFWLIGFIFIFDFLTCRYFGMDVPTSIVNGFVEFVPVSFNEPIVEQLHGINPKDPKYGPPLLSLGYSALVTGYRLLSYILLSVLIAAWAGYFRKKNQ